MKGKNLNKAEAAYLRKKMEAHRLNQSELARVTGMNQEKISRLVNEQSRMSVTDLVTLTEVIDLDFYRIIASKLELGYDILCQLRQSKVDSPPSVYFPVLPFINDFTHDLPHQLCPPSQQFPKHKETESIGVSSDRRYFTSVPISDRGGLEIPFAWYFSKTVGDFQMEYRMGKGIGVA